VAVSYSPPPDFAGYHFRYATSPGAAWGAAAEVDPLGLRGSGFVLLTELPAAAVEVLVKPQDLAGQEGDPEARQLLGVDPPTGIPLAPDYTGAWLGQKTDGAAAWTQHAADLEMTGGATGGTAANIGVVTLAQYPTPCTIDVDYVHAVGDTNSDPAGVYAQIGLYWLTGANPNLTSLGAAVAPVDSAYQPLGVRGLRCSLDTKNTATSGSDKIRWRALTDAGISGNLALAAGETLQDFAFPPGGAAHVKLTLPGDGTVRADVDWPGGTSTVQRWSDPLASAWMPAGRDVNIVLANSGGRDASWSNLVHKKLTVGPPGGSEGIAPPFATPASASDIIEVTAANLMTGYARLNPGQVLVVNPGTYTGAANFTRSGQLGASADERRPDRPLTVRAGTVVGGAIVDPASFPAVTIAGAVTVSGDYNWLRGLAPRQATVKAGTKGARFNRCAWTSSSGVSDTGTDSSFDWCEFGNIPGVFLLQHPRQGCRRPLLYRSWLHDGEGTTDASHTMQMMGQNNDDDFHDCLGWTLECLFGPPGDISEAWECKSNGNVMERCRVTESAGQSLRSMVRHGSNNQILALYTNGYVGLRGAGNRFADSVAVGGTPQSWGPFSGNITFAAWQELARTGDPSGRYPRGEDCVCTRIVKPIIGHDPSGGATVKVSGTIFEDCGPPSSWTLKNGAPTPTTRTATIPPRTDTGAVAWPTPSGAATDKLGPNGRWSASD
jgi:hypothetical protein